MTLSLLLLLAVLTSAPQADPAMCFAADYEGIVQCLELPAASDPAQRLDVVVLRDIELDSRERIDIAGKHYVTLRGLPGARLIAISESIERMNASGGANRYMVVVSGGSDVVLRDLRITDPPGNDLDVRCRAGADPERRLRWERDPCEAPLWVGDGAERVTLERVTIDSHKAIQMEVRTVTGLTIRRSTFAETTVFGILLHENFYHEDIVVSDSLFRDAGANSIVVHNAREVRIERNRFVNNHRDMQFLACGDLGLDPCSGGQLLVKDQPDRPVRDVWIVANEVVQTDPTRPSATGIEIGDADRAPLEGIRIIGNYIVGHVRQGIQVHFGRRPGGHDVLIAENHLVGNGDGYASLDVTGPQITLNGNTGVVMRDNVIEPSPGLPPPAVFPI